MIAATAVAAVAVKAYTKGAHVLRLEAVTHNRFGGIVAALAGITERFCTAIDCVAIGFLTDGVLDDLPRASQLGAVRVAGIDLNQPRTHAALSAVLALAAAPGGFTVGQLAAKVHTMTGHTDYTVRQAADNLRKLRGKHLVDRPGRSRRYQLPAQAARTITTLLTLRDQVIAPVLAGVRSPRRGRRPTSWTTIDRDYEQIRIHMQTLLGHLGLDAAATAAA